MKKPQWTHRRTGSTGTAYASASAPANLSGLRAGRVGVGEDLPPRSRSSKLPTVVAVMSRVMRKARNYTVETE